MLTLRLDTPVLCLLALALGCTSHPKPVLEDRAVLEANTKDLQRLTGLFEHAHASYPVERDAVLRREPRVGAWLAKSMVGYAVGDYDRLLGRGLVPERIEKRKEFAQRTFFRARAELVALGDSGRRAIAHYLLRSKRGQLRELGGYLLRAHPSRAVVSLLEAELRAGTPGSKREAIRLLGVHGEDPRSLSVLESFAKSADWQLRGTAVRALAGIAKRTAKPTPAWFWKVHDEDEDPYVRQQALLAVGDLGDIRQARRLVDALEAAMRGGDGRSAEAAARALKELTGRTYGTRVASWRIWLDGRRTEKRRE